MLVILVARIIKQSVSESFREKRAGEAVEASKVAEDTEVNEAAEIFKA